MKPSLAIWLHAAMSQCVRNATSWMLAARRQTLARQSLPRLMLPRLTLPQGSLQVRLARWRCCIADALPADPRYLQIALLVLFVSYAKGVLQLAIRMDVAAVFLAATLATEWLIRAAQHKTFDPLSPLITALSLTLLMRTQMLHWALVAGVFAIAAKYLLRVRGKQVFNPSNIAIVVLLLATNQVWISPGQWGQTAIIAMFLVAFGTLVSSRAVRLDLALMFLLGWAAALIARSFYLQDPLAIAWHQLQDGTLLIFCFFMLTDPRATPDHRAGRALFAALLIVVTYVLRFEFYEPDALLLALAAVSTLTPVLDCTFSAERFRWTTSAWPNPSSAFSTAAGRRPNFPATLDGVK